MFWSGRKHSRECDETLTLKCDNERKERICWKSVCWWIVCTPHPSNTASFSPLLSVSVCSILHAGIVLNTGWHCWRHLGQSCFDFIIHVSCSRLGPHVKDTSGFLLNSLLRIELWLACLLANTVHSIYCGAAPAWACLPQSVCFFVCVILPFVHIYSYRNACVYVYLCVSCCA